MNPRDIRIADYTYTLPDDRIAKYPLPDRDLSKLLLYKNGDISENVYRNIASYIPADSLVIFNDTKVVHARLLFPKETGSTIEVFCLEPDERYADITTGMMQTHEVYWKCLVGKADKWKEKELHLRYPEHDITITASIVERQSDCYVIHLRWGTEATFAEILYLAGAVPLPPYIKRKADKADSDTYQTIYSRVEGSVAAPTAGLHFTERIFDDFRAKNIHWDFVTLHVGAGTFKPVKAEVIADHQMHAEWLDVPVTLIEKIKAAIAAGRNIVAVGTTATRTLESLFWIGAKVSRAPDTETSQLAIQQWDAYDTDDGLSTLDALAALLSYLKRNQLDRIITRTQLLIAPGYQWRIVRELVTNFHQPDSTLLLLVAALIGDDWRRIYKFALEHDFRFLSYGDGCYLRHSASPQKR